MINCYHKLISKMLGYYESDISSYYTNYNITIT